MKKIKLLSILATTFICAGGLLTLSSCNNVQNPSASSTIDEEEAQIRALYQQYAADGGKLTYSEWLETVKGPQGETGISITSIEKTGTDGLVDTYTITFSNDTTTTFTVTNGAIGLTGEAASNIKEVKHLESEDTEKAYKYALVLNDEAETELKFEIPREIKCNHLYSVKDDFQTFDSKVYFSEKHECLKCNDTFWTIEELLGSFDSGDGTETNPFIITTSDQFKSLGAISTHLNEDLGQKFTYKDYYYKLGSDVTLDTSDVGTSSSLIPTFRGTLDGDNHKLTCRFENDQRAAKVIFGALDKNVTFKNINCDFYYAGISFYHDNNVEKTSDIVFDNVNILDTSYLYCGRNFSFYISGSLGNSLTFKNCTNSGIIECTGYTSAFIGANTSGKTKLHFENLVFDGSITAQYGGLLQGNASGLQNKVLENVTIINCRNKGIIQGEKVGLFHSNNITVTETITEHYIEQGELSTEEPGQMLIAKTIGITLDNDTKKLTITDTNSGAGYVVTKYTFQVWFYASFYNEDESLAGTLATNVYTKDYDDITSMTDLYAYTICDYTNNESALENTIYEQHYVFKETPLHIDPDNYTVVFPKGSTEIKPRIRVIAYDENGNILSMGNFAS